MDFINHKVSLKPVSNDGSIHITHVISESNGSLWLTPSNSNCYISIGNACLGTGLLVLGIYFLFALHDVFAAFALAVGGVTLVALSLLMSKNQKSYQFICSQSVILGLENPIKFNEIKQVELLKKIVNSKTHDTPFQSGEICISTLENKRHLLVEGADPRNMKAIAIALAEYVGTPLAIDETLNRV